MPAAGETVTGSLSADGPSGTFRPIAGKPFNVYLTGSFTASVTLQRAPADGTDWATVAKPDLSAATFTAAINFSVEEPVAGTTYRWLVSGYAGTAVGYRFEQ